MQCGEGKLIETYRETGRAGGLIHCPSALVPAPGQYVQAAPVSTQAAPSVLPTSVFSAGPATNGFLIASPLPESWVPGRRLLLRGPIGHGFSLPAAARRVALVAWDERPGRLLALLPQALAQGAEVTLACSFSPLELPEEIEIQPLAAVAEIYKWADFLAIDADRDSIPEVQGWPRGARGIDAQVLIQTSMPCGALAECGVCAVSVRHGWKLACKDGPVFDLRELES